MMKGIKVQLKPNNKQNSLLVQSAGTARWAYNWVLGRQQENYEAGGKFISHHDLRKELTQLKKTAELNWLTQYSNNITKQAIKDACNAFIRFFKIPDKHYSKKTIAKAKRQNRELTYRDLEGYPRFKSKRKSPPKFYHDTDKIKFTHTHVQLEKLGKVKMAEYGRIPVGSKYINPRISFDGVNWWIAVGVESNEAELEKLDAIPMNRKANKRIARLQRQADKRDLPMSEPIGIDVGIKTLATISNGETHQNINKTKAIRNTDKRLKRLQKQSSRAYLAMKSDENKMKRKGKNHVKLENQINKTYKRLTNLRTNHLHQITSELVIAKPEYIVIEDLNVKGMMKNKHLSKAIAGQCLGEFRRQLEYKCLWYGVPLIIADRWYASSKTCSCCGTIKKDLNLSDRTYRCIECGLVLDRDVNASINLREYPKLANVM